MLLTTGRNKIYGTYNGYIGTNFLFKDERIM